MELNSIRRENLRKLRTPGVQSGFSKIARAGG